MGNLDNLMRSREYTPSAEDNQFRAQQLARIAEMRIPRLQGNSPHERTVVALFDGTGQQDDQVENRKHGKVRSAIAYLADELQSRAPAHRIGVTYQKGVGSDGNVLGLAAGAGAMTKVEAAYADICRQFAAWQKADPQAQLRVISAGFSRGGDAAAALTRIVHDRGIQDPDNPGKHLLPPGRIPQGAILLDPVATGVLEQVDRRLPASTLFAIQTVSRDERRSGFESTRIVPDGKSADERMLSVTLPGSHGDMAHSYARDAASVQVENTVIDVLNTALGRRVLDKVPQSRGEYLKQHETEWVTAELARKVLGEDRPGARQVRTRLAPDSRCASDVEACFRSDPVDKDLQRQFQYQKQDHAPVRHTEGPGHTRVEPPAADGLSPDLKPALAQAIEAMKSLQARHPELASHSAAQLAAGAMNHWQASGAKGMFREVTLTRTPDGGHQLVMGEGQAGTPAGRREAVTIESLTRQGFEESLAQLVQARAEARQTQDAQVQQASMPMRLSV